MQVTVPHVLEQLACRSSRDAQESIGADSSFCRVDTGATIGVPPPPPCPPVTPCNCVLKSEKRFIVLEKQEKN